VGQRRLLPAERVRDQRVAEERIFSIKKAAFRAAFLNYSDFFLGLNFRAA
jgi:hypothetical protein